MASKKALLRYGHALNSLARSYGIKGGHPGATLLAKLERGESGGHGAAVSRAGARGWAQFMPSTRQEMIRRYGIDPWRSEDEALHAASIYLRKHGGLHGYNPGGGQAYVRYILGQKASVKGGASGRTRTKYVPGSTKQDVEGAIIDSLLSGTRPQKLGVAVLRKLAYDPAYTYTTPGHKVTTSTQRSGGSHKKTGHFSVAAGANRQGVPLADELKSYLSEVAGVAGHFTVGTGSNHNKFTVSGHVSDHWTGHGADVPATGRRLIRLGQAALIAAGVSPAKARKTKGGLFNINWHGHRVQIIFNVNQPGIGDHTNHLHVGLR